MQIYVVRRAANADEWREYRTDDKEVNWWRGRRQALRYVSHATINSAGRRRQLPTVNSRICDWITVRATPTRSRGRDRTREWLGAETRRHGNASRLVNNISARVTVVDDNPLSDHNGRRRRRFIDAPLFTTMKAPDERCLEPENFGPLSSAIPLKHPRRRVCRRRQNQCRV